MFREIHEKRVQGSVFSGFVKGSAERGGIGKKVVPEAFRKQKCPRVLLLGTHLPPGIGSSSVGEGLAERLRERGYTVRLSSSHRSRILRVIDMLTTAWIARHKYDVAQVDVYSGSAFRWAEWVTRLLKANGKPFVLALRGGNLPQFARNHPRRVGRLLSSATAVTAPSQYLVEAMQSARSDIQIIPNPLAIQRYSYIQRVRPKARLVWLRAFHQIYDPVLAVRVLARVASYIDDAHLTMIGRDKDGSLALVRAEANQLGVSERIHFTGGIPKSDVPIWLARGDIFLNTTTIDNTPVSVLEAMATGLPVISTSAGEMPHLLEHGRHGILVPLGDADAMAEAVMRLITEEGYAATLSRSARAKAESFGWDSVLPQWERLFVEVARTNDKENAGFSP